MTAKDSHDELKEKFAPFSFDSSEFAAIGRRRMEEFGSVQTELIQKFQEASQKWLERFQEEAKLSADFGSRLMRASSMPEAMNILQEWNHHRFEMIAQDGKRLLDDTQKLIETGARSQVAGWREGPVSALSALCGDPAQLFGSDPTQQTAGPLRAR